MGGRQRVRNKPVSLEYKLWAMKERQLNTPSPCVLAFLVFHDKHCAFYTDYILPKVRKAISDHGATGIKAVLEYYRYFEAGSVKARYGFGSVHNDFYAGYTALVLQQHPDFAGRLQTRPSQFSGLSRFLLYSRGKWLWTHVGRSWVDRVSVTPSILGKYESEV